MTRLAQPLPAPRPARRHPPSAVHDWARSALHDAARTGHPLLLSIPAPRVGLEALLSISGDSPALLWDSPGQSAFCGAGVARQIRARGPSRFGQVQQAAKSIMADLRSVGWSHSTPPAPRLVGGFAFRVGDAELPPWNGFGDGWFVLPRLRYDLHESGPRLVLTIRGDEVRSPRCRSVALEQLLEARDALAQCRAQTSPAASGAAVARPAPTTERSWNELVDSIVTRICAAQFEKVAPSG